LGKAIVCSLVTKNDHAERRVALIQVATRSKRVRSDNQLQFALQVIDQNLSHFPDARKSTLLKTHQAECGFMKRRQKGLYYELILSKASYERLTGVFLYAI